MHDSGKEISRAIFMNPAESKGLSRLNSLSPLPTGLFLELSASLKGPSERASRPSKTSAAVVFQV